MVVTLPGCRVSAMVQYGARQDRKGRLIMVTIREHNRPRWDGIRRQADYIMGVTLDGGFLCAECVGNTPAYGEPGPYGPNPVFSSNDYSGMMCESCLVEVD